MKPSLKICRYSLIIILFLAGGCSPSAKTAALTSTTRPAPQEIGTDLSRHKINPDRLYQYLIDITGIQAYSGWRTSATEGEKEGLDTVQKRLNEMENLKDHGLSVIRDTFNVFLATEIHQTSLVLSKGTTNVPVPVNGLRGSRDNIQSALRLDSDGVLNDTNLDPVTVTGQVSIIRDLTDPLELRVGSMKNKILFVDYAWVDTAILSGQEAMRRTMAAMNAQPAGIVFVTHYSNLPQVSHGTYLADLGTTSVLQDVPSIPTVYMRLEDLPGAGSDPWNDLAEYQTAYLTWDTDVLSPGTSGNLIAKIPGKNSNRGVLLSAHIDSANTPGALDDGAGAAILLEVAAALNEAKFTPEYDLYLVWYGSEEIGLLGSANFTASHQDIIDKLIGMVNVDCLTRPVDGAPATLNFAYGSGMQPGDTDDPWVKYLVDRASASGVEVRQVYMPLASDNSSFAGYDVANLDIVYDSEAMMNEFNGVWFAGHLHDPYDEVSLVREVEPQLLQMANIALDTATLSGEIPYFRQTTPKQRVLFIASHTEDVLMTPAGNFDLGLAFQNAGLDVDVLPFGTNLRSSDLENVKLVIALPIFDLPSGESADSQYDVAWTQDEVNILNDYVEAGGSLIITNSANRVKYYNTLVEFNEDWNKMNALAAQFGIEYQATIHSAGFTTSINENEVTLGVAALYWFDGNAVAFSQTQGTPLATQGENIVLGKVDYGKGTVITLADIGMISAVPDGLLNSQLVQNLIGYAQR